MTDRPARRRPIRLALPIVCALLATVAGTAADARPPAPAGTAQHTRSAAPAGSSEFPAGDEGYHTYAEMHARILEAQRDHPDIVRVFSIGQSYEGRDLWAAEVSDNVGVAEGEPEVLFDGLHHAREHMSAEMTLAILGWLADGYASDARIRDIVDSRRIWIVFMVNPDGSEYDISGGTYRGWRRNRQPTPGTDQIGTDINRNYGYHWGCCGGSSSDPASSRYRGPYAFSTPEARAMRDFLASRVVGGQQRIVTHITFHTSGRLVMYPYGYTLVDVPRDMTQLDHEVFRTMAEHMAASDGYTPEQSSDLYISSGTLGSYTYGRYRIFGFVFELTSGDYPPDERIGPETRRNREAVLYLLEMADCPYRAIGQAAAWCGPFFDDLEIDRGWAVDPDGGDGATAGRWKRGAPKASPLQRTGATSGEGVLVTGRLAGQDVDGGRTTVRSPLFRLPEGRDATLRLKWWLGLDAAAGPSDGLTVRLVDEAGATVLEQVLGAGDGTLRAPVWRALALAVPSGLGGSRVAVELEARDAPGDGDATVEAGVDAVRVTAQ